jgi:hypothetical protein
MTAGQVSQRARQPVARSRSPPRFGVQPSPPLGKEECRGPDPKRRRSQRIGQISAGALEQDSSDDRTDDVSGGVDEVWTP